MNTDSYGKHGANGNRDNACQRQLAMPSILNRIRGLLRRHDANKGAHVPSPEAEALKQAGNKHLAQGDLEDAATAYRQAIAIDPLYADAYNNLGFVLKDQQRYPEALAVLERTIELAPTMASAHFALGSILHQMQEPLRALTRLKDAVALDPHLIAAHCDLVLVLTQLGKITEAQRAIAHALALRPDVPDLHIFHGNLHRLENNAELAIACYRRALALKSDYAEAHYNLGVVLESQGELNEATEAYRHAFVLPQAQNNLGNALATQGRHAEAIVCYHKAMELQPDSPMAHSNLIFLLDMLPDANTATLQTERRRWNTAHAASLPPPPPHDNILDPERRLRVGYVSADFREHSAATVFGAMLTQFDAKHFDVFAYSNKTADDEFARLFRKSVTSWRDIADSSDEAVVDLIRSDRIDILVDLSGHSGGNRLLVFAHKPAPIQITAWGYATSTGLSAMDVFFADPVLVPPDERSLYAEHICYLPNVVSYFQPRTFPPITALPAAASGCITFGSFNRVAKISAQALAAWAKVLHAVPGSRIVIKSTELDDVATRDRITEYFSRLGIHSERVTLIGKSSWFDHMAAFAQVDIALDPFPHGGGVTALEGLIMGVPYIALRWPTIVGRLSASFLTTLGLTDWIAENEAQYVNIATNMASNLNSLASLRSGLRSTFQNSIIGNTQHYVHAVEREYRLLWQQWCASGK